MSDLTNTLNKAEKFEKNSNYWEASELYVEALLLLNKSKGNTKEKKQCKMKIREMNILRSSEFIKSIFQIELSDKEKEGIREFVDYIVSIKNIETIFNKIGKHKSLCPNFQVISQSAKANFPVSFYISTLSTQSDSGDLVQRGDNPELQWFSHNYAYSQIFILGNYLIPIFQTILNSQLGLKEFIGYFQSKELYSSEFLVLLERGIERFFSKDYTSSLHILVPLFERLFMAITGILGEEIDTITARHQEGNGHQIWTEDKILSEDFLKNDKVQELWGKDFCEYIIFVFYSKLGIGIRHKIAHGKISLDELTFENTVLVLYFFISIASRFNQK